MLWTFLERQMHVKINTFYIIRMNVDVIYFFVSRNFLLYSIIIIKPQQNQFNVFKHFFSYSKNYNFKINSCEVIRG